MSQVSHAVSVETMVAAAVVCPSCHAPLDWSDAAATCSSCGARYDVIEGIPILRPLDVDPSVAEQAQWFDEAVDKEFEIERPRGMPALYGRLLESKFRRSIEGLDIAGATVLAVCGGSGLDAEFLAGRGAQVISADISLGAAKRAAERARRHGVDFLSIVADTERLPFADRSVDVVYVHDGLHHIPNPIAGLLEMARVASRGVCVTEPADAFVTAVAVKLGLALAREEAGNRVARLRLADVCGVLRSKGYAIARAQRYAMYYRHEPGPVMEALSLQPLLPLAEAGYAGLNAVIGRAGNKLVVQAVRR